jgi:acyl-coenzyme A thioesterase PaaI-like protein
MTTVDEPIALPWSVLPDYRCFGCSPHNPQGLRLQFTRHGDDLRTEFRLGREYESYPGVIHGGLLGVIADEIMGNLIVLRTGRIPFTTGLRLRYLRPVTVGRGHSCAARLREDTGRLIHTEAAAATASYRTVSLEAASARIDVDAAEVDRLREALPEPTTDTPARDVPPEVSHVASPVKVD